MPHLSAHVHSALLIYFLITRMIRNVWRIWIINWKSQKNVMEISKYIFFFWVATSKVQGDISLKTPQGFLNTQTLIPVKAHHLCAQNEKDKLKALSPWGDQRNQGKKKLWKSMLSFSRSIETEHFGGEILLSNALGQAVHAHHLFFSLQYQMWQHQTEQTALSITQLEETNALQCTAQYSYGQPPDNDLNDHKAVVFIIQNFKKKPKEITW